MPKFVELWVYLSATPLFGLTATLVVYVLAQAIYARFQQAPWANPVLWTVLVLAAGLLLSGVPYPTYFAGAQFIHFLLGPAVVALAWPLWQRRAELRQRWGRLLLAALMGGFAASRLHARVQILRANERLVLHGIQARGQHTAQHRVVVQLLHGFFGWEVVL